MGSFGKFRKAGGRATVAGSSGQIQFNDDGSLAGDSGLTFVSSTDELNVGFVQLTAEQGSAPADPGAGNGGYLYTKADGKVYWRSNDIGETDLTVGATSVAGSDTQLQYNNGGSAGGASNLVYNDSNGYLGVGASGGALTHRLTLPNTSDVGGRVKANAFVTYSSKRYKDTIQKIENPLDILDKINGVTYQWKDSGRSDIGFIAEDVGKILPCVVDYEKNGVDAIAMDYTRINAVLVEAVKEQTKIIFSQKKQLDKLTDLLETLNNSQKDKFKSVITLLKDN
jgi:hypothetical protein